MFADENGAGRNAVSEILRASLKRGIFDSAIFKKYGILTSHGIQMRFIECCARRKIVEIKKEYLLLNPSEIRGNVNIIGVNVYNNSENVYIGTQSKVNNKSKKEIIKVKGKVKGLILQT